MNVNSDNTNILVPDLFLKFALQLRQFWLQLATRGAPLSKDSHHADLVFVQDLLVVLSIELPDLSLTTFRICSGSFLLRQGAALQMGFDRGLSRTK